MQTRPIRDLTLSVNSPLRPATCFSYVDSSPITIRGQGFDEWTAADCTCHTQGFKLHVLFDAHAQVPVRQSITISTINDVEQGRQLPLEQGARYVFDKAYCDYNW